MIKIKLNEQNEIWDLISIAFVDGLVLFSCFMASFTVDFLYFVICAVVIGSYYLFLLTKCNAVRIVKYQIILLIMSMFFLDMMFYFFRVNAPYELYYISEGISLVLLIKIGLEKASYKNIMKDFFLQLVFIIILSSFAVTIINWDNLGSYANALRIFFRYIPVYIVLSRNKADLKKMYQVLYVCNIALFLAEWVFVGHQDYRNGIFGSTGGSCFQIFIMIYLVYVLIRYLYKQTSVWHFALVFALNIAMLAIAESKASIVMVAAIVAMIAMIVDTKLIKKFSMIIIGGFFIVLGFKFVIWMYPDFKYLSDIQNLGKYVTKYLFGNSNPLYYTMGRFEGMQFICQQEQVTWVDKLFGLGLGEAIPQERWFHIERCFSNQKVFDFPASTIFAKYGVSFGYHLSVLSFVWIGTGYIGVAMVILIILCIIYKACYLLRNGNTVDEKTMGGIGFFVAVMGIYTNGYSSGLLNTGYVLSVMVSLGIMQNYYNRCSNRISCDGQEE